MHDATRAGAFACADLTTFCRLDELGLVVTGQRLEPKRAVLACKVVEPEGSLERWCRRCGAEGLPRDTVTRELAHEPVGWRPTTLRITVRRYRCTGCGHVWRQDTHRAAQPRAKLSRRGLRWALEAIVVGHLSMSRVAEALGVAWGTANDAVLAEGRRALIEGEHRYDGVTAIGVDEHVWRHTRRGDKYVTVVIDLTAVRAGTGPARLLDMIEGRSKKVFKTWLAERPEQWRQGVEVVAMDGFTGFKTAAVEELPDAVAVMLTGVYYTIDAALPALLSNADGGAVVITSSAAGFTSVSTEFGTMSHGAAGYTAAKHGVIGVMRHFARSLAEKNIRVNSVHPGGVATPMVLNEAMAEWVGHHPSFSDAQQPLLRLPMMEPGDISDAMVYLCGPAGRYLTGVALPVDAGQTLK